MSDSIEGHTGGAGSVVAHPNRTAGRKRILSHEIAAQRTAMIASLERVIEHFERLSHQPGFDFVAGLLRECELMILQLEALDPSTQTSAEEIGALPDWLGRMIQELHRKSPRGVRQPPGKLEASA